MVSTKHAILAAATILRMIIPSYAAPSSYPGILELIAKREISGWEGCGDENDPRRIKANRAFVDAATLANWTLTKTLDSGASFKDTKAYSHYFEDTDKNTVMAMMGQVEEVNKPSAQFSFQVSCPSAEEKEDCTQGSLAVTDARPADSEFTPTVRLCPLFFDDKTAQTMNDLGSKRATPNAGRRDNDWCKPGQTFKNFETAGHTVFHEMTHLDGLGNLVGLSARDVEGVTWQTHGTDDIYAIDQGYGRKTPPQAASKLKENWAAFNKDNKKKKPSIQRVENAEGFAAAATEFYFQQVCGFTEIAP